MKVLVVEFGTWHDECLYSICKILKLAGHQVTVAANEKVGNRLKEQHLDEVSDDIVYFGFGNGMRGFKEMLRFRWYIMRHDFDRMHINTGQGSLTLRFFLMPLPLKLRISGTLHNVAKVGKSFGQGIITRRIDDYVLLSDILIPAYKTTGCKLPCHVQYAVFKSEKPVEIADIEKPDGELWLVVPGAVSYGRRDFRYLLEQSFPENVRIIILGNANKQDGPHFRSLVEALPEDKRSRFVFFNGFVPNDIFYAYIDKCDALLPLVHPWEGHLGQYATTKISGTYNLSVMYRKPMLCPEALKTVGEMSDIALFYPDDGLGEYMKKASGELSESLIRGMFSSRKWTEEYQIESLFD